MKKERKKERERNGEKEREGNRLRKREKKKLKKIGTGKHNDIIDDNTLQVFYAS